MIKFTKFDEIDVEKYLNRLRYNGYISYVRDKMSSTYLYESCVQKTLAIQALDLMKFESSCKCFDLDRYSVYRYLVTCAHCPQHYFRKKGTDDFSLDSGKVLSKLIANGYATDFLDLYMASNSKKSKCGKIKNLLERCTSDGGENEFGEKLNKIYYNVSEQQNLRCNYKNEDIIAIPKEYNSCISVEDGYFLAWGDFAQSDFRIAYNLFIRSPENDEIMNKYEDKYEALARIVSLNSDQPFNEEEFKKDRPLYKRLTLATMYGTGNSLVAEEAKFITKFTEFLSKCPRYVEYKQRLNDRILLNLPLVVTSYFGHMETIPTMYDKSSMIDKALNTPIQSGTSEIIILTVNKILDMFYDLGYTSNDVSVYYVRHDEPIFKIKKEVIKDLWVLEEASTVIVDNWTPLKLDFRYGYTYKQPDESLEEIAADVIESNKHRITKFEIGKSENVEEFYPVSPICKLYVSIEKLESVGKTILTIYSLEKHQVLYSLIESIDDEQINFFLRGKIAGISSAIYDEGYRGILVQSNFYEAEDFVNRLYIRYLYRDTPELFNCNLLCRYMALRYCAKYKVSSTLSPILIEQEEIIKTVGDLKFGVD